MCCLRNQIWSSFHYNDIQRHFGINSTALCVRVCVIASRQPLTSQQNDDRETNKLSLSLFDGSGTASCHRLTSVSSLTSQRLLLRCLSAETRDRDSVISGNISTDTVYGLVVRTGWRWCGGTATRVEPQQREKRDYFAIFLCELKISFHHTREDCSWQTKMLTVSVIWLLPGFYQELMSTLSSA